MFDNPYVETFFTRSNNRCGCIFSKMDKALFDLNWLIAHPKTLVEFLPPGVLNHAAFSISFASNIEFDPNPFKFFNFSNDQEGFPQVMA